eukprot:CAMPEP_0195083654 /NCGR_PEP_ID=MMETSP0448-20130528/24526_1 /TAXON_ID=66468 /ORGANISM="Heterocapsa triquestra, Strain CCMP 448" /LENGTH=662 /DNA_ID=CAMNT_0040116883 /DNA_START=58 /DNA_END=2046 /DNA_ORIENTATION=-
MDDTSMVTQGASMKASEGAICIILAAGFSQVERDIAVSPQTELGSLVGVPKALLPVAGKPMLDYWWEYVSKQRTISEIFIVSNALAYKQFERWATARGIAMSRIINSGATTAERSRGVLRDVELGLRRAQQSLGGIEGRDLVVFAGDTLFFKDFDLERILDFRKCKGGSLCLYYGKTESDKPSERGMCEVDGNTSQVVAFAEKPKPGQRGHEFAFMSPLFYILESAAWRQIQRFNKSQQAVARVSGNSAFSFGCFVEHAVETLRLPFWGMRMPGAFHLIGASTGLEEYQQLDRFFKGLSPTGCDGSSQRIRTKSFARVGLMGNPSDGFHGKTIAVTVQNFWASVELWESERLTLLPHPLYDPSSFSGLADLHFIGRREGYYGGSRLLMATCKRFQELCTQSGIALPRKNFTVKYDTNIPRQVGLAGSSAIVNALFKALMALYNLSSEHIPMEKQPSFILSVESELGIQAGLQDRVVQVYQGLVFMDFDQAHMAEHGHGRYERLPRHAFEWLASLPLFIAYESDPSDSGKIHSNVRARWDANEPQVIEAMQHFAELTVRARAAIEDHDQAALADLMDENFATRRRIYGDACLGKKNLQMIEICQKNGAAAKFPGSGGAVLGLCRSSSAAADENVSDAFDRIREAIEAEGFVFCPLDPVMPAGL